VGTAPVTRGTVTQRVRIPGTYGFDGAYTVVHQGPPGIVTATAAPGATVERGGILYAVDNRAVRLLYGDLPAYRDFGPGMTDGSDVRQLEQNLVDLGLGGQITVDDRFTAATGAAVRQWQAAWGLPAAERTGTLPLGQVVFLPGRGTDRGRSRSRPGPRSARTSRRWPPRRPPAWSRPRSGPTGRRP
jgi:hypothetical protein